MPTQVSSPPGVWAGLGKQLRAVFSDLRVVTPSCGLAVAGQAGGSWVCLSVHVASGASWP